MLRTGMIALQLLPSNCLAGIVVFTDGCTDVYGDLRKIENKRSDIDQIYVKFQLSEHSR